MPRITNDAPMMATYRRPMRSEIEPTNGQTAARESRLASTNQIHLSVPPISE